MAKTREQQLAKERDAYKGAFEALTALFGASVAAQKSSDREIGIIRDQTSEVVAGGKGTTASPVALDKTRLFTDPATKAKVKQLQKERKEREGR